MSWKTRLRGARSRGKKSRAPLIGAVEMRAIEVSSLYTLDRARSRWIVAVAAQSLLGESHCIVSQDAPRLIVCALPIHARVRGTALLRGLCCFARGIDDVS